MPNDDRSDDDIRAEAEREREARMEELKKQYEQHQYVRDADEIARRLIVEHELAKLEEPERDPDPR